VRFRPGLCCGSLQHPPDSLIGLERLFRWREGMKRGVRAKRRGKGVKGLARIEK